MKLRLHLGDEVNAGYQIQDLNLMLVFQVNCPGCLSKALPDLNSIAAQFPQINVFALSSAFENFAVNTINNTQILLTEGVLPPACKRYFGQLGHQILPYKIQVPVVMDAFISEEQLIVLKQQLFEQAEFDTLSPKVQGKLNNVLEQRFFQMLKTGRTFLDNEMQGTPTWYLFDKELTILDSWLGHKDRLWIKGLIERYSAGNF